MTSLDEIRQAVTAAFQAAHGVSYSSLLVNYPNHIVVDIEHQADPFISVDLDLSMSSRAALGEKELLVPGTLLIYYYFQDGTGSSGAYQYADMLNENLCMQQVGHIYYHEVKPKQVQTFPGWRGLLCSIKFEVSRAAPC